MGVISSGTRGIELKKEESDDAEILLEGMDGLVGLGASRLEDPDVAVEGLELELERGEVAV